MTTQDMTQRDIEQRRVAYIQLITLRAALGLEISCPGMQATRGRSALSRARSLGYTSSRRKVTAYEDVTAQIVALGGEYRSVPTARPGR